MPQRRSSRAAVSIDVKAMRQKMGLSQTDLVEKIYGERNRVHKRTIRAWEHKEQKPGPMARRHLERVLQEFEAGQKTEGAARPKSTRTPSDVESPAARSTPHLAPGITSASTAGSGTPTT